MSTADAPPPAALLGALSTDWFATLLAIALAGLAWVGIPPHVGWQMSGAALSAPARTDGILARGLALRPVAVAVSGMAAIAVLTFGAVAAVERMGLL